VAPGVVEVQSERQVIQHPDGGVVGEILARDGDSVAAGDVLLRLDGTFLRSELAIVESQLAEILREAPG
jgi:multidrug efflux pump subunit AcrA (membrane-fusion protein)